MGENGVAVMLNNIRAEQARLPHHQPDEEAILETFDRAAVYDMVPADECLPLIGRLCGTRTFLRTRIEKGLFGGSTKVRLLAIMGTEADTRFASAVYYMVDELISAETAAWSARNHKAGSAERRAFEQDLTKQIRIGLHALVLQNRTHTEASNITEAAALTEHNEFRVPPEQNAAMEAS